MVAVLRHSLDDYSWRFCDVVSTSSLGAKSDERHSAETRRFQPFIAHVCIVAIAEDVGTYAYSLLASSKGLLRV
jgi:hypothetical protein